MVYCHLNWVPRMFELRMALKAAPVLDQCAGSAEMRYWRGERSVRCWSSASPYTGRAALYSPPWGQQEHLPSVTSLHVQEKCGEQTWHLARNSHRKLSESWRLSEEIGTPLCTVHCSYWGEIFLLAFYNFRQKTHLEDKFHLDFPTD